MAKSSNASPTQNGFLFQINVAIYLMTKYIANFEKIRVEGEKEDVEVHLNDKSIIMVQVKSQWDNFDNKNNVLPNLKKSLLSLNAANSKDVKSLIYVCNFPDPLKNNDLEFTSYRGITQKRYLELNEQSQDIINNQLKEFLKTDDFDFEKLWIIRIPFFGEDEEEKHKFIYEIVNDFLIDISGKISRRSFVRDWESNFLRNGSNKPKITISKSDLSSYLILSSIENYNVTDDYKYLQISRDDFEEACEKYSDFIDEKQNCYEAICKINSLYERKLKRIDITKEDFVQQEKLTIYNYLFNKDYNNLKDINNDEKIDLVVSQIIAYVILRNRNIIKRIREKVQNDGNK